MAASGVQVEIQGLDELRTNLGGLADKLRRRALRNALAAGARIVRDAAKAAAPVLAKPTPYRTPGTLRNAISVRTSKVATREGNVGTFVNVRPARGGARGAKSPTDPYFWKFVEFGTKKMRARPFLQVAAKTLPNALDAFEKAIGPQIQKLNTNPKDPL